MKGDEGSTFPCPLCGKMLTANTYHQHNRTGGSWVTARAAGRGRARGHLMQVHRLRGRELTDVLDVLFP